MRWYSTLFFSGWCIPPLKFNVRHLMVYNPVISGWCIPSTGIQFPQGAGRHLSRDCQPTEYSCFRDDHASPQALIPVIPSVLVFFWRREWDSNPRMLSHRRFSRPVPSTTRPPLRIPRRRECLRWGNCFYSASPSVTAVGSTLGADAGTATLPPTKPASRLRRSIPKPFSIPLET